MIDDENHFFYTYRGGLQWNAKTIDPASRIRDFEFYSYLGWTAGTYGRIFISYDGGRNWRSVVTGTTAALNGLHYFSQNGTLWCVGNNGLIITSNDHGFNWIDKSTVTADSLVSIQFSNSTTGWLLGWKTAESKTMLLKTTNRAESWQRVDIPVSFNPAAFYFTDAASGWLIGENGTLLSTNDGGNDWQIEEKFTLAKLRGINFKDDTGWIVGENGIILRYDLERGTVIKKDNKKISAFSLHQNYPNPFNQQTAIRYRLSAFCNVKLEIYNTLGQFISTLVNEEKQTGEYKVIWNGKDSSGIDVPSGIYFYRLKAGEFTDVKKMILLR